MKTETKFLGVMLFITILLLGGGIFLLSRGNSGTQNIEGTAVLQIDYTKGEKIGSDSAKVKLVEFSDFECPACLAVEPYVKKIRETYPEQVQLIYRQFPLPQHLNSREAANLSLAAAEQGKFWEMHGKLFDTQTEWSPLKDNEANAFFLNLAKELNLDVNKVKQQLDSNAFNSIIEADIAEGRSLGVNSTPTFYLNGRKLNLQSFEDLNRIVESEIKK